jgi:hypothetical protein
MMLIAECRSLLINTIITVEVGAWMEVLYMFLGGVVLLGST